MSGIELFINNYALFEKTLNEYKKGEKELTNGVKLDSLASSLKEPLLKIGGNSLLGKNEKIVAKIESFEKRLLEIKNKTGEVSEISEVEEKFKKWKKVLDKIKKEELDSLTVDDIKKRVKMVLMKKPTKYYQKRVFPNYNLPQEVSANL